MSSIIPNHALGFTGIGLPWKTVERRESLASPHSGREGGGSDGFAD